MLDTWEANLAPLDSDEELEDDPWEEDKQEEGEEQEDDGEK